MGAKKSSVNSDGTLNSALRKKFLGIGDEGKVIFFFFFPNWGTEKSIRAVFIKTYVCEPIRNRME